MIFLDLDGCLVDFIQTYCHYANINETELMKKWKLGLWDMSVVLGITDEEFYQDIERYGEDFWTNAFHYPYSNELFDLCQSYVPTVILTTPTYHHGCVSGKLKWLQRWRGNNFRDYVFTPKKELCAKPGRVLIDDRDTNIDKFREAGGIGLLFPAHTNSEYKNKDRPVEYVKEELEKVFK